MLPLPKKLLIPASLITLSISLFTGTALLVFKQSLSLSITIFLSIWLVTILFISPLLFLSLLIIIRASIDALSETIFFPISDEISITASQAFGIFTVLLAIPFLISSARSPRKPPLFYPFLLLIGWGALTASYSVDASITSGTGYEVTRLLTIFFIFTLAYTSVQTKRHWKFLLNALLVSAILPFLIAVYQLISGIGYHDEAFGLARIYGTFAHPNVFATFFVAVAAVTFITFESSKASAGRLASIFSGALACLAVLFSYTRIAWLALSIFIFTILTKKSAKWIPALLLGGLSLYVFSDSIRDRVNEAFSFSSTSSILWRFTTWNDAITYTLQSGRIWFGSGLNTFSSVLESIRGIRFTVNDPHSEFIRAFVEGGIIGLAVTLFFYGSILLTLFLSWQRRNLSTEGKNTFFILFSLWIALTLASFTDHILRSTPLQWVVWSLMGGAFAVFLRNNGPEREHDILENKKAA